MEYVFPPKWWRHSRGIMTPEPPQLALEHQGAVTQLHTQTSTPLAMNESVIYNQKPTLMISVLNVRCNPSSHNLSALVWKRLLTCVLKPVNKKEVPAHMGSQMALKMWTVWLVCFAVKTGGKLATFITVNLRANVRYAKVPCCKVISLISLWMLCCHGVFRCSELANLNFWHQKKKIWDLR